MALTPEEMGEVELELGNRMKPKKDPMAPMGDFSGAPDENALGTMQGGGMGFGGINPAAQGGQLPDFNPASEQLLVDPAGMNAGAAAQSGFSNSMSLANALRKGGKGGTPTPAQ